MVSERDREKQERAVYRVFSEKRMTALALLILPLLFIELTVELTPIQTTAIEAADWIIWALFVAEFTSKLYVARSTLGFLTANPFERVVDLTIIFSPVLLLLSPLVEFAPAVPLFRLLNELRFERLLKAGAYGARGAFGLKKLSAAFYEHRFYHYMLFTIIATLIASSLIFSAEHAANPYYYDYWSALWWSLVTVLTVGGLAATPITLTGRVIAGGLMLLGIGLIATLTANIAAFFIEEHEHTERETPLERRVVNLLRHNKEVQEELEDVLGDIRKERK